jgi:sugar-specific transcriptional regulator TrmB
MFEKLLQDLGFSEKETKVYLSLNQYGPMPASTIARLTEIKRTSVYDILNALLQKNVITSYRQGIYTYFAIDDINKLYLYEKEKLNTAKLLIENLKDRNKYQQNIQVNYYRGKEGYVEVYDEMIRSNPQEILCWTDINFLNVFTPQQDVVGIADRVRRKISMRILMKDSPRAREYRKNDSQLLREIRLLPATFRFETTLFIYQGHVIFFDYHEPATAIRIQHDGIYLMMKEFFEITWPLYQSRQSFQPE